MYVYLFVKILIFTFYITFNCSLACLLQELKLIYKEIEDPNLGYPSWYLVPIHAYETANLNWLAAIEAPQVSVII